MSVQKLSDMDASHIDTLSSVANEPQWLKEYRRRSFTTYDTLPLETSPLYNKYTDAKRLNPAHVLLSVANAGNDIHTTQEPQNLPAFLQKRLDELSDAPAIVQFGTRIIRVNLPSGIKDQNVTICSIYDAIINDYNGMSNVARRAVESADSTDDKFTALNNAAFNSGVLIHIPDNTVVETPIHVILCMPQDGTSVISRNVIYAGTSSASTIVQELYSADMGSGMDLDAQQPAYMELLNANVSANARLDITTLQMLNQSAVNFSTRRTELGADSSVNWYSGLFGSVLSRYRIDYFLRGSGASANDSEVVFGNADQSFDIQTNVNHESPATEGRVVEKSILRDKSRSLFKGMIRIKENASKSNSFLSGRSILLDPDAKSDAIPGLEIFTNDVKATHSASVAQIDEEQIFYLQSRCLSKEEAERTIVEGFLEPLSRKMSYQVRAWIAYLIESKWEGRDLGINTDAELAKFVEVEETRYNEDAEIEQHYKYR